MRCEVWPDGHAIPQELHAGDDAAEVQWLEVGEHVKEYRNLYANHKVHSPLATPFWECTWLFWERRRTGRGGGSDGVSAADGVRRWSSGRRGARVCVSAGHGVRPSVRPSVVVVVHPSSVLCLSWGEITTPSLPTFALCFSVNDDLRTQLFVGAVPNGSTSHPIYVHDAPAQEFVDKVALTHATSRPPPQST